MEDVELIENLENTKVTAQEIAEKSKEAKVTEASINASRETYRPAAARSSLIYFVLNQLWVVEHMYQYSLGGFMRVFLKAVSAAEGSEEVAVRVGNIISSVTYTLFSYASRGLFSRHKLIFASQLSMRILDQAWYHSMRIVAQACMAWAGHGQARARAWAWYGMAWHGMA